MKQHNDEFYMREALREAEKAVKTGDWPIGCIIVHDGKIIARAHNKGYSTNNRIAHAELLALQRARHVLLKHPQEATLYTTFDPCPMCVGAMLVMKIKRVVTGINPDKSGGLDMLMHLPDFYKQSKFALDITRKLLVEESNAVFLKGEPTKMHMSQYDFSLDK